MHQPRVLIHADMSLVAEMPRVALLRLAGVRIALLFTVLCRGRCRNDGGIHDRALLENQPARLQKLQNLCKQPLLKTVFHQQRAEPADRITVRHLVA